MQLLKIVAAFFVERMEDMLERNKMKKAAYICERISTESKEISLIEEEWVRKIKLPKACEKKYYEFHKKDKQDFYNSLTLPYEVKKEAQEWICQLEEALDLYEENQSGNLKKEIPLELTKHPFVLFANLFVSYVDYKSEISNRRVKESLKKRIIEIVLQNSTKTLLHELWNFKSENTGLDSSVCYQKFIDTIISKKGTERLIYQYPLLFRVIMNECNKTMEYYREVEKHFQKDLFRLREEFDISGELVNIKNNVGDTHKGQKQVLILEFEIGKAVYKPRNLGVDRAFEDLVIYINNNLKTNLQTAKSINCGEYGWQEYIEYTECENENEIREYYKNMGIYSCILYSLIASDMHMENIIAHGKYPIFIDLESLFQGYKGISYEKGYSYEKILGTIRDSVLATSLFPGMISMKNSRDISGITGCGKQKVPKALYAFENLYTADMRIVRKDYIMQDKKNIPQIKGEKVNPRKYVDEIVEGFCNTYDFIQKNKSDFLKAGGILESFYHFPVRTILRDTANYGTLLKASTETGYMSDASNREQLFDRLWYITHEMNNFELIVPYEIRDMSNGDIPYFSSTINNRTIYDSYGNEIGIYYKNTIADEISKKILNMCDGDKRMQIDFIRKSLAQPIKRWELKETKKNYDINLSSYKEISNEELVREVYGIANVIEKMASYGEDGKDIGWMNIRITPNGQWAFMPMDNTLYEGTMGIGIFMAQLFSLTKNEKYGKMLYAIIESSNRFNSCYRHGDNLSAFNGNLAVAYCSYYIYCITKEKSLKKVAIKEIDKCKRIITNDNAFDIISGCAGALIVSLRIYDREKIQDLLDFAVMCGEHILANVVEESGKYGWYTAAGTNEILAGMSHGNAGIAWALTELYKYTSNNKYLECANKAINYEESLYNEEDNNWTDMRNRENRLKKGFPEPVNWCHGAPGIGLSRIFCKRITNDEVYDNDIKNSIRKTLSSGFGGSDCICHGSLGNIEILLNAANLYHSREYYTMAKKILKDLLKETEKRGWICGIPQRTDITGFMTGLSGIGYELLRMLNPKKIPCVLSFEFPD